MNRGIKLLTFNVFLRPPPIKTNEDDYKEQRFMEILNVIDNYDIVCFQEMFQTATFRPQRIIKAAIKKKFYYWKISQSPSFLPGPVVDSGLMVLSRFPIVSSHFQSYKIGILSDSASDKGYIYCKINANGQIIHLFVTHLQASYKLPGKQLQRQLSVKTRLYQFDILMERIKNHLKNNQYKAQQLVLLAGDLNIDSNEKPYKMTQQSCLKKLPQKSSSKNHKAVQEQSLNQLRNQDEFVQFNQVVNLFQKHQISVVDHAFQKYKGHPITFGDGDTILTGKEDQTSHQSLDYIFTLDFEQRKERKLKCRTQTCQVQQFKYNQSQFGQLSDHYGVSIIIQ